MRLMKRAALVVGATSVVTLFAAVSPAHAGVTTIPEVATLTITKVVQGDVPAGTTFTIRAVCEGSGEHELAFGADGGQQQIVFTEADQCDITEPDDGGSLSTTGLGEINISEPIEYSRTVVNTFAPAPSSSSSSSTSSPIDSAAAATTTQPRFTG
jgi:hypothetical protein